LAILLLPGIPIEIPDVVYTKATRIETGPGATRIVTWINRNSDMIRIIPRETGIDHQRRLEENCTTRGMGEQAALETLDIFPDRHPKDRALLLFDAPARRAFLDERANLVSTGDLLRELEHEKNAIIQAKLRLRS
jgi:hypothetical protein